MGDIYLEHRDTLSAIESYKKGIELSTREGIEKAQVLIILGDLYYDKKSLQKHIHATKKPLHFYPPRMTTTNE